MKPDFGKCPVCNTPLEPDFEQVDSLRCPVCRFVKKNKTVIAPGNIICNKYRVLSHFNSGGCGELFLCHPLSDAGVRYVLKVLKNTDQNSRKRFRREAMILSSVCKEERIARVIDFWDSDDDTYIIMEYINGKNLSISESAVGFDLNGDGEKDDTVALTIEYDADGHADTNGYYGTYVDLYLAEFEQSLNDYLARLDYTEDWTWFNADGTALSDSEVAAMTSADRAQAFIEGRYAKGSTGSGSGAGGMEGGPGGSGGPGGDSAGGPPDMSGNGPDGDSAGGPPDMNGGNSGNTEEVGTPDAGTTQSASSTTDSANYSSFAEMLAAYQADIAEVEAGDKYGNNIVELYDPTRYVGAEGTNNPTWARILMGASEGDISMFNSLNMQIAWLNAGTDAVIEWQWNGGHVPSEIFGD